MKLSQMLNTYRHSSRSVYSTFSIEVAVAIDLKRRFRGGNLDATEDEGAKEVDETNGRSFCFFLFFIFFNRNVRLFCTEQKYKLFMKDEVTAAASPPPPRSFPLHSLPSTLRAHSQSPFSLAIAPQRLPPRISPLLRPTSQIIIPRSRTSSLTTV